MESRAMLPTRISGSWEGAEHSGARVDVHVPIQPGDGSTPSDRNIWRHFESYKRSAILHTAQYLQHSAAMYSEESAFVDFDSLERVAKDGGQVPEPFWDLKAARDNLFNDLGVLQSLSDYMLGTSKKGLGKCYALIALLTVAAGLSASDTRHGLKRLWESSVVILAAVSGYTGYRILKYSAISLCSAVIDSLLNRLHRNTLDEHDRNALQGRRFQLLWWTYHFTTKEVEPKT
ncbi:hypothetical protein K505DRAFT_414737 [Melanomma pulvis-pyrius CBS 109.77]|uniref:Uncharacterized protein n=1 Tax=Melanomma pulvis-pyrius CBS 109.77 TaxID=1314802 RepID=A0A6A6XNE0_9PLEO|nr:hypothetical protein K505DRAFT_414737 [Melanomma pulvis-pyrius CBS 109.77]